MSINRWNVKTIAKGIHIYNGILSSCINQLYKKKEILSHATTWTNLEDIMLSEISQSQKDKYCMIPLIWCPKFSNFQKEKAEWWSLQAGGGGKVGG